MQVLAEEFEKVSLWIFVFAFLFDFAVAAIVCRWVVHSLFAILSVGLVGHGGSRNRWVLPVGLIVLQNFFVTGRVGLVLIYLVPVWLLDVKARGVLLCSRHVNAMFFLAIVLIAGDFIAMRIGLSQNFNPMVTTGKIFASMVSGYLILFGASGSRFLAKKFARRRKVWTPSRMGAS
jgi:hypothetical protein